MGFPCTDYLAYVVVVVVVDNTAPKNCMEEIGTIPHWLSGGRKTERTSVFELRKAGSGLESIKTKGLRKAQKSFAVGALGST